MFVILSNEYGMGWSTGGRFWFLGDEFDITSVAIDQGLCFAVQRAHAEKDELVRLDTYAAINKMDLEAAVEKMESDLEMYMRALFSQHVRARDSLTDDEFRWLVEQAIWECRVVEVKEGVVFRIKEYDGFESIEIFDPSNWTLSKEETSDD